MKNFIYSSNDLEPLRLAMGEQELATISEHLTNVTFEIGRQRRDYFHLLWSDSSHFFSKYLFIKVKTTVITYTITIISSFLRDQGCSIQTSQESKILQENVNQCNFITLSLFRDRLVYEDELVNFN